MHKMIQAEELFKHLAPALREMCDKLAEQNPNVPLSCDFDARIRCEVLRFGESVADAMVEQVVPQVRDVAHAPTCSECENAMAFKQIRPMILRTCLTGSGRSVRSPYWQCSGCHRG